MTVDQLYTQLRISLQDSVLNLSQKHGDGAFMPLLSLIDADTFILEMCTIEKTNSSGQESNPIVTASGLVKIPPLNGGQTLDAKLICREEKGKILYTLSLQAVNIAFQKLFGTLPVTICARDGFLKACPSVLDDLVFVKVILCTNSEASEQEMPFFFEETEISFETSPLWEDFKWISGLNARVIDGKVSLHDHGSFETNAVFTMRVKPQEGFLSFDLGEGKGEFGLLLESNAPRRDKEVWDRQSRALVQLHIEADIFSTPIDLSVPLFKNYGYWPMQAAFENGLGLSDVFNFMAWLFHLDTGGTLFSQNTPLDAFKLYALHVGTEIKKSGENNRMSLADMKALFSISKPWKLPIPKTSLDSLSVLWETTWGNDGDMLNTADLYGKLSFGAGSTLISLSASARLPGFDIEGHLNWSDEEWEEPEGIITLSDLAGIFDAALPKEAQENDLRLGSLNVYASPNARSFSVQVEVDPAKWLTFQAGNLPVRLEKLTASANLSPADKTFTLGGEFGFGEGEERFALGLEGTYSSSGGWLFEGGLQYGEVNLGRLVEQFDSASAAKMPGILKTVTLTNLYASYGTQYNEFTVSAGLSGKWPLPDFPLFDRIDADAFFYLERDDSEGPPFLTALFSVDLGILKVNMQADEFFDENKRKLILKMEIGKLHLTASYEKKAVSLENSELHELLTVRLDNLTFGDIVEAMIQLVAPNRHSLLDKPWDVLHQVDISRARLIFDATDKSARLTYDVSLSIAGLGEISALGLSCKKNGEEYRLDYVVTGKIFGKEETLAWDAVEGQPPAIQNGMAFKLNYLGLGQHIALLPAEAWSGEADEKEIPHTITDELLRLRRGIREGMPLVYKEENRFLFGLDCLINNSIHVQGVLNDPNLYGLLVTVKGTAFDGLSVELLYSKVNEDIGMFRAELLMPEKYRHFNLGAVALTLGIFSAEIYTNGDFLIDLGFPSGGDFKRSFVLEAGQFVGRGGIRFGKLSEATCTDLPKTANGVFQTVILAGVGLSLGIGRSFDFGVVRGGVSLEASGIFEGIFAVFQPDKKRLPGKEEELFYRASAALGLYGYLYLSADLKVLAIEASVEIRASVTVYLESYKAILIALSLALELKAKIKILFFKINFSFKFEETVSFVIGEDRSYLAPWGGGVAGKAFWLEALRECRPFPAKSVMSGMEELKLKLVPIFSHEGPDITIQKLRSGLAPQHCVAFIPMFSMQDFTRLEQRMARWLLSCWQGDQDGWDFKVSPGDTENLTNENLQDLQFENIAEFLAKNVKIEMEIPWHRQNDIGEVIFAGGDFGEMDGVVFPMPPDVGLQYQIMKKGSPTEFRREIPVNEAYVRGLQEYFAKASANPNQSSGLSKNMRLAFEATLPQVFFADYFQLILGELHHGMKRLFQEYTFVSSDFVDDCDKMDVKIEDIITGNPDMKLAAGADIVLPGINYTVSSYDTLEKAAANCRLDVQSLWKQYRERAMLPRKGAKFDKAEAVFTNTKNYTLKQVAALYFVRYCENEIQGNSYDCLCRIFSRNPSLNADWECTDTSSRKIISLPDSMEGVLWESLSGDTPDRLAKMCMVLDLEKGEEPLWDSFLSMVSSRNNAEERALLKNVKIPAFSIRISSDSTLASLQRRAFLSSGEIAESELLKAQILSPTFQITTERTAFKLEQETTVRQLMEDSGIDKVQMGEAIRNCPALVITQQSITVKMAKTLMAQAILDRLTEEENCGQIAALSSRFLLQGLRIPHPETKEPTPYYKLAGQQFSYQKDAGLRLFLTNFKCRYPWLSTKEPFLCGVLHPDEIENLLPSDEIQIQSKNGLEQVEAFRKTVKYYVAAQTITLQNNTADGGNQTLHLLSDESVDEIRKAGSGNSVDLLGMDQDGKLVADIKWGALIPFLVSPVEEDHFVYQVQGADAKLRLLLQQVNECLKNGAAAPAVRIFYESTPLNGVPNCLVYDPLEEERCLLVQTNLSLETHRTPVVVRKAVQSGEHIAGLREPEQFLRLLWECSVVGGGGYYLRLENKNRETLPVKILAGETSARLWIFVEWNEQSGKEERVINSALTRSIAAMDETFSFYSPQITVLQPSLPIGCIGLETEIQEPDYEADDEYNRTRRMFSIVGYKIREDDYFAASGDCAPVSPKQGEPGYWKYDSVIPIEKFMKEDKIPAYMKQSPYKAVGRTAQIGMEMRDVLGNLANMHNWEKTVYIQYNDLLIGLHEWPGVGLSYQVKRTEDEDNIILSIFCAVQYLEEITDSSIEHLKRSLAQIACDDVEISLSTYFEKDSVNLTAGPERNKEKLLAFGQKLLIYMTDKKKGEDPQIPEDFVLEYSLPAVSAALPKEPFPLKIALKIKRTRYCQEPANEVVINVPAAYPEDKEGKSGIHQFVTELEAVFPTLRIAQANDDHDLYGITFGRDGFIKSLSVKPYEQYNSPRFYALRPLNQSWLSGSVSARLLSGDGKLNAVASEQIYTGIDLQVWANRFLDDLERALSPKYAVREGLCSLEKRSGDLQQLINSKGKMARIISEQLKPVYQIEGTLNNSDLKFMKRRIQDRLSRSLKEGFAIDLIAQFALELDTESPCRITVSVQPVKEMEIQASKVGNYFSATSPESKTFCLYANMSGRQKSLSPKLHICFEELEYHIQDVDSYESSRWLKFINPINPEDTQVKKNLGITVDLSSELKWPHLLKNCPFAPVLTEHGMILREGEETDLKKLLRWDYGLKCRYQAYEQDKLQLVLEDTPGGLASEEEHSNLVVFKALAEYEAVRDKLWTYLKGGDETRFRNAFESLCVLTEGIQTAWEEWLSEAKSRALFAGFRYTCEISVRERASSDDIGEKIEFLLDDNSSGGAQVLERLGAERPVIFQIAEEGIAAGEIGDEIDFAFKLNRLPLMQVQTLVPRIKTIRNQTMFDERPEIAVDEAFIYKTQEVSLPAAYACQESMEDICLGEVSVSNPDKFAQMAAMVFDGLEIPDDQPVSVGIWYSYKLYENSGEELLPVIWLPVCMVPGKPCTKVFREQVSEYLNKWFTQMGPQISGSSFRLKLTVHGRDGKKDLLYLSHLKVKLIK